MNYKIEKKVPRPIKHGAGRRSKYPLREMKIGDSFLVTDTTPQNVRTAVAWFAMRHNQFKFCTAKEESGIRVWRIKKNGK